MIIRILSLSCMMLLVGACSSEKPPKPPVVDPVPAADLGKKQDDKIPVEEVPEVPAEDKDEDPTDVNVNLPDPPDGSQGTPDPNADKNLSGGSGGQTGEHEIDFRDTRGTNSSYKINAPADVHSKVYGLHIHLHGDGGGGYRDFPNKEPAHDLIGVTVKAPNFSLTWGRFAGVPHAAYVHDLIQEELLKKYNVDKDRIYFSGVSGGAYFLTGNLIPSYGHHYNSGAFVLCGGEPPRVPIADAKLLTNFKIYWQVTAGERRDIIRSIEASTARYKELLDAHLAANPIDGFDSKSVQDIEVDGEGGHCEYDGLDYTGGIQSIIDRKFEVVLKQN